MGPLFSGILLLAMGGIATVVSFGVARIFLPMKPAAIAALLFVGFGGLGTVVGLFGQAIWQPSRIETTQQVLTYLGVSALCGLSLGSAAVWIFVTRRRSGRMRA